MPLAGQTVLRTSDVVSVVQLTKVVNHAMQIVNESVLTDFLLRVKHIWCHVQAINGEVDLVVHLLVEHDIVLLEPIEAEDEDGSDSIQLNLLECVLVLFAAAAVPAVLRAETLCNTELLKTALD